MQSSDLFHYCFQKQTCTCFNKSRHGRCSSVLSTHTTLGLFSFQSLLNAAASAQEPTVRRHRGFTPMPPHRGVQDRRPSRPCPSAPRTPAQPMTSAQRGAASIYILLQKKRASTYMRGKGANNNYLNAVPTISPTAPPAAASRGSRRLARACLHYGQDCRSRKRLQSRGPNGNSEISYTV